MANIVGLQSSMKTLHDVNGLDLEQDQSARVFILFFQSHSAACFIIAIENRM